MLNQKTILTKSLLITLGALLILPLSLYSFSLPSFEDLPKKSASESSFKKPTRQRKTPHTKQEREEQSMQQTLDELAAIAEGLSKFTQAKETEEASKTKAKKQETKEKEAAQRLKQQQQSQGRSWSPSSGSYSPSRSSYGGSGYGGYGGYGGGSGRSYGGGYGSGSSPWATGRSSSPWATSSSGFSPSKSGGGYGSSGFDDYDDEDKTDKKKDTSKKTKGGSGAAPEPRKDKDLEANYTKLVNNTKKAADLLENALTLIGNKTDAAAAVELLNNQQFGKLETMLNPILTEIQKSDIELSANEKKNLENKKGNLLKQQQDRFSSFMNKFIKPALVAATLNKEEAKGLGYDDNIADSEQQKARSFLQKNEVRSFLKDDLINKRGTELLNIWNVKNQKNLTTQRATLKTEMAKKGTPAGVTAGAQAALKKYFDDIKTDITTIAKKFPKRPDPIVKMLTDIDADLDKIDELKP